MRPNFNLWIEVDGEVALSIWRARLLEAVDRTGSITAAAEALGVPYRIAWQKIHEMEERLGEKLVLTKTGGSHGGGATLSAAAELYLEQFARFSLDIERLVLESFRANFGNGDL